VGALVNHAKPISIRNNRFAIGLLFVSGLACLVLAPITFVIAVSSLFTVTKPPFDKMYGLLAWTCGGYLLGTMGGFLLRQASGMNFNHVELTAGGVGFGIKSGRHETKEFFYWNDIRAVTCRRIAHMCVCTVQASSGREFSFDSYMFLRPKHIVRLIIARIPRSPANDAACETVTP
jgi:hypothetical protein